MQAIPKGWTTDARTRNSITQAMHACDDRNGYDRRRSYQPEQLASFGPRRARTRSVLCLHRHNFGRLAHLRTSIIPRRSDHARRIDAARRGYAGKHNRSGTPCWQPPWQSDSTLGKQPHVTSSFAIEASINDDRVRSREMVQAYVTSTCELLNARDTLNSYSIRLTHMSSIAPAPSSIMLHAHCTCASRSRRATAHVPP